MKIHDPKVKQNLQSRLRRIEGQARGVQNMVDEERDCREIMQQLSAIRSAVQSATALFLQEYATHCLLNEGENDRASREELVENLVALFGKAP